MLRKPAAALAAVLVAGCSVFGIRSGTEQPVYRVVERLGDDVEIRRYGPRTAAETVARGGTEQEQRGRAFGVLFDYISGANQAKGEIAMTAPVATEERSEKVAMTAPVATTPFEGDGLAMRFFLPDSYTLASAPEPTDPRVQLVEVPAQTLAVVRFSGSWDEAALAARERQLLRALEGSDWRANGTPFELFYDPPFALPFLRRNEVAVPVEPRGG
jgi:hypothetical protein